MTRKSDNKAGNATVAAVQQSHVAAVHAAKSAPAKPATPQKSAAAAPMKPAGVQSKPSTPSFSAKPATPQPSKVQAAPAKAAPQPAKAATASPSTPVGRKVSQAPIYEMYMVAALFSEPANWTANQAPCHAPHRAASTTRAAAAKPVLGKQNSAASQIPVPKAAANNNNKAAAAQKVAPKQAAAMKQKAAVKWNSAAGKQLILRPKGELVLFQPLWVQVQVWSVNKSKPVKGRSAGKNSKQDRIQQQKQRVAAQRKPEQVVAPKQQPNAQKPLSRQASAVSSKPATPAPVSRNPQKTKAAAPQKGVSSPVNWQANVWEDFYTSKHSTFKESAAPSAKSKPTTPAPKSKPQTPAPVKTSAKGIKHASLKSTIPPPSEAKSPEIFSFVHSPTAGPMKPPSPIFVRKHADGFGHPATFSRQNSNHSATKKASPPPTIHAARLPKQNSNSSPTGNMPDHFASYMDRPTSPSTNQADKRNAASAVPLSPSKQYAAMRATKAKPAPYMTASGMPREMANAWAEGANYKSIQLVNDAEARGIQYGPQQQARGASNSGGGKQQKKPVKKQSSWFTPHGFAVASAAVVLGGVGIGALMN
ncbi:hypothetical protein BJ741DRAFT_712448 [Chytriomyces cf. hyalinus JEL632]|nr:hypothetical protein BJ741DRAFT_712448 [Chytriomyces cf. hyalinus JEL632]